MESSLLDGASSVSIKTEGGEVDKTFLSVYDDMLVNPAPRRREWYQNLSESRGSVFVC